MWKQSDYKQVAVPNSHDFVPYIEIGYGPDADIRIPTRGSLQEALTTNINRIDSSQRQDIAPSTSSRPDTSSNSNEIVADKDPLTSDSVLFQDLSQMSLEEYCPGMTIRVYPDPNSGAAILHNLSGSRVGFLCRTDPLVHPILNTGEFAALPNESQDVIEFDVMTGNDLLRLQILRPPNILCTQPSQGCDPELQIHERTRESTIRPLSAQLFLNAALGQEAHFPTTGDIAGYSLIWVDRVNLPSPSISVVSVVKDPAETFFLSQTINTQECVAKDLVIASSKFTNQWGVHRLFFGHPNLMKAVATDPRTLTTLFQYEECRSLAQRKFLGQHNFTNLEEMDVLRVLAGVASLLNDMHDLGLVHGQVEPANIFYSRSRCVVKLMSLFNVALVNDMFPYGGMTECVQTWYLAPEELEAGKRTQEGDIFALGVTGLFLLGIMPLPETNLGQFDIQALILQEQGGSIKSYMEKMWTWLEKFSWGEGYVPTEEGSLRALLHEMVAREAWRRPSARRVKEFVEKAIA
ncbi:MAG: hypothetical protein Q9165_003884 [Trypethelium subeluteriae]